MPNLNFIFFLGRCATITFKQPFSAKSNDGIFRGRSEINVCTLAKWWKDVFLFGVWAQIKKMLKEAIKINSENLATEIEPQQEFIFQRDSSNIYGFLLLFERIKWNYNIAWSSTAFLCYCNWQHENMTGEFPINTSTLTFCWAFIGLVLTLHWQFVNVND